MVFVIFVPVQVSWQRVSRDYMHFFIVLKRVSGSEFSFEITQSEALIIPHILREPNSIIVLLFFENILNSV